MQRRIKYAARRDEVAGEGRNLDNEKLHDLCWVMKSRKGVGVGGARGTGHGARWLHVNCVQIVF